MPLMSLNLGGNLWIGGTDGVADISSITGIAGGFQGCMNQLTINDELIDFGY